MNRLEKTLISGIAGSVVMTAGSALMTLLPEEEFREPDQLKKLVGRIFPRLSGNAKILAAWSAHFGMGVLFAAIYVDLWEKGKLKPSIVNGLVLGLISGAIGTLIWKTTFSIHPLPPNNKKIHFYLQRIPAHVIFSVFATLAYQFIQEAGSNKLQSKQALT